MSDSLIPRGPRTAEGRARCGNWKHGRRSAVAKREAKLLRDFIAQCRSTAAKAKVKND